MDLRRVAEAGFALAMLCAWFIAADRMIEPAPFGYDEADYAHAARSGIAANALDTPSLSFRDFLERGIADGRDPSRKTSLSAYIRTSGDVLFYRHWHGPLYYYALAVGAPAAGFDEQTTRRITLIFPALAFLLMYVALRSFLPGAEGGIAGLLFGFLYLFSYANMRTAAMLAPHSLFGLLCLAALVFAARLAATRKLAWWYAAVAAAALTVATLEVGVVLAAALAGLCWIERRRVFAGWTAREWLRFALQSLGLYALVLTIVWPAALWKLSLLKACLFMGYLAVFRKGAWGNVTFGESWWQRLTGTPVEWLLIGAAVVCFVVYRNKLRPAAPALLFAGLMLLAVLRVITTDPRYMTVYLPAFHLFTAMVLAHVLVRFRPGTAYALVAVAAVALVWNSWRQFRPRAPGAAESAWAPIALLREKHVEAARLLVPQGTVPSLHFYFPQATLRGYAADSEAAALASTGGFDGILRFTPAPEYEPIRP